MKRFTDALKKKRGQSSQQKRYVAPLPFEETDAPSTPDSLTRDATAVPFPEGIKELHSHKNAIFDICFIHGLTGDRERTWTAPGQETSWPELLLPSRLTHARILTWGYDAYLVRKGATVASSNRLIDHATNLLNELTTNRSSNHASSRSLIFVTHSLGGLVCKMALILSRGSPELHLKKIFENTKAIIFMGTPHTGSWMADWGQFPARSLGMMKSTNLSLLSVLQTNDQFLESLQIQFLSMLRDLSENHGRLIKVTCFFEELGMPVVGKVVSKASATLPGHNPIAVHANHRDMVRFATSKDNGFKMVLGELARWEAELLGTSDVVKEIKYNVQPSQYDAASLQCVRDLRLTDPRDDRARIMESKDPLLKDSCQWILDDAAYIDWRDDDKSQLLWIKGDPGKGKTMLMIALAEELSTCLPTESDSDSTILSYFFCQSTNDQLNSAASVIRGLIYFLLANHERLVPYLREKYDTAGPSLYEGANSFYALSSVLSEILNDPSVKRVYLLVDALDECDVNLPQLLNLITHTASSLSKVKWLVSSRNRHDIEEKFRSDGGQDRISLELNSSHISRTVSSYVQFKVSELSRSKNYDEGLREEVNQYLREKAEDTFLWVALVCKELHEVDWLGDTLPTLKKFPSGLQPLYARILQRIQGLKNPRNSELCQLVLSSVTLAHRPIQLRELPALLGIKIDQPFLRNLVNLCSSFLTVREDIVYFVHQSAKDFFSTGEGSKIFPSCQGARHRQIACHLLQVLSHGLRRDICGLGHPGTSLTESKTSQETQIHIQYACNYWIDHILDAGNEQIEDLLQDGGKVHTFFLAHFLHWLEALSLFKNMSGGISKMKDLESVFRFKPAGELLTMVRDAYRFMLYHRAIIEEAPLQIYASAIPFSPRNSLIRQQFLHETQSWVERTVGIAENWGACLQTLEGHGSGVSAVAFSPDGQRVVSGSEDNTVRLWDVESGALQQTLEGHGSGVKAVAFSPDGQRVVSGSRDKTVRLWDVESGALQQTLEGHRGGVKAVAFSPDGQRVVSGSWDNTVRLWDVESGALQQTLEGHGNWVTAVAFSPDGQRVVSGSRDSTVRLWDVESGALQQTLEGHRNWVKAVAFSPDGQRVVSGSWDNTVRLWDVESGALQQTLEGHRGGVTAVAFSPDGQRVVSGSHDKTVRLWDVESGALQQTLEGHGSWVTAVAFSPDGQRVVSGSEDETVRLWDVESGALQQTLEGHGDWVTAVAFSPDGQRVVSGSGDKTVRLWDVESGALQQTLEGHGGRVTAVAFSADAYKSEKWPQYSIDKGRHWITYQGQNFIWLPPDYQPSCQMFRNNIVLMGHSSGRVTITWLKPPMPPHPPPQH